MQPFHWTQSRRADDQRLDLCELQVFQSPIDKNRTVIILNANPNADAIYPDAVYHLTLRQAIGGMTLTRHGSATEPE
jgi:hypothetical protein